MSRSWDTALFRDHSLVACSSLSEIQCFDVYMPQGNHGRLFSSDRGPVISRIGSLMSLAKGGNDWPEFKEKIEMKSTEAFASGASLKQVGDIKLEVKPSLKLLAGLGLDKWASASSELSSMKSLVCKAVGVAKATVKPDIIEKLVNGSSPVWMPDTTRKELYWPPEG